MDQEQKWAAELNKARRETARLNNIPTEAQKSNIQKMMLDTKLALRSALRQKNKQTIQENMQTLIKLRAEQTAIDIQELQEIYGNVTDDVIKIYAEEYMRNCAHLLRALRHYLH